METHPNGPRAATPEREIAEAIRDWIRDGSANAREMLARSGTAYGRSFLVQRCALRRFGFTDRFDTIAEDVAAMEVATLLQPEPQTGLASPMFRRRLSRSLGTCSGIGAIPRSAASQSADPTTDLLAVGDVALFLAWRKLLRLRVDQGLRRRWGDEHPEQARLLRRLKEAVRRRPEIRLRRDVRGVFVASRSSDLSRRPLAAAEIRGCFDRFLEGPKAVFTRLLPMLVAGDEHGGYCYLMDLVREIHADRLRRFTTWCRHEAEISHSDGIGFEGIPIDLVVERMRRSLLRIAEEILERDRQNAPAETRAVWREVAVAMILRRYGLDGDREESGPISQRRILESRLGT